MGYGSLLLTKFKLSRLVDQIMMIDGSIIYFVKGNRIVSRVGCQLYYRLNYDHW